MQESPSRCEPRDLPDLQRITRKNQRGDLIADKYLLDRRIGQGGMGSVWRARDTRTGISIAIKLLCNHFVGAQREYVSARMTREATTLANLRHPAIVRILDFGGSSSNDPYIAMELLEGESFGSLLARSEPLVPEYVAQLMLPIAHGLAAAHDIGVVHRDLKPDNIFLAIDGRIQPKVIDFGIVKLTRAKSTRKLTGIGLLGTPDYMAPEQALERPDVDHRSDVWAFSAVLYEALSGKLPFHGATFAESLYARIEENPVPLTDAGIDAALWRIVQRGLEAKPEDRWQSMRELGAALAAWLVSRGVVVDVTGAALHDQWRIDAPSTVKSGPDVPSYPSEEDVSDVDGPRSMLSSGLHLRADRETFATEPEPSDDGRRSRSRPARARSRTFRLALAGVAATIVVVAPEGDVAEGARAVSAFVIDVEPQVMDSITSVAHVIGEHLPDAP
jgi:serine/threonine protein kinase